MKRSLCPFPPFELRRVCFLLGAWAVIAAWGCSDGEGVTAVGGSGDAAGGGGQVTGGMGGAGGVGGGSSAMAGRATGGAAQGGMAGTAGTAQGGAAQGGRGGTGTGGQTGDPAIATVTWGGTLQDGQEVSITGTGFGPSGPEVVLFDDFGRGSEGEVFSAEATIGTWTSMKGYAFSDPALSRGRGARQITPSGHVNNGKTFGEYSEVFVSSRAYVPDGYRFPRADADEAMPAISALKHHWLMYGPKGYGTEGHDVFGPGWTGGGWMPVTTNKSKDYVFQVWGDPGWEWDKPVRWTHWIKGDPQNNLENTRGYFQGITSTQQKEWHWDSSNMDGKSWFGPQFEAEGMPYAFDRLSIVGYFRTGNSYPQDNYVIDDVYLAVGPNSAARVEIGNNEVYSSCTKMAIGTPTSWSSTQIGFTVREGSFRGGDGAYVFVVDANNTPSSGYPVAFGEAR